MSPQLAEIIVKIWVSARFLEPLESHSKNNKHESKHVCRRSQPDKARHHEHSLVGADSAHSAFVCWGVWTNDLSIISQYHCVMALVKSKEPWVHDPLCGRRNIIYSNSSKLTIKINKHEKLPIVFTRADWQSHRSIVSWGDSKFIYGHKIIGKIQMSFHSLLAQQHLLECKTRHSNLQQMRCCTSQWRPID
jgi:hypothetical protein